jgi:hypothetical protein
MNAPRQHRQPLLGWPDTHMRALAIPAWVAFALLGSCPPATSAALPDIAPAELAECMRRGARALDSLVVEQHFVNDLGVGEVQPVTMTIPGFGPITVSARERMSMRDCHVLYKMKQHFLMEYSHVEYRESPGTPVSFEREMAWNGEFFTWLRGKQGTIAPKPDTSYHGMSYLFLRLLYYPTEKEAFADYLVPPSIWRVEFEAPTTFEGNPCYVLSLHPQLPGKPDRSTPPVCWRLIVCPRFGFATVEYRTTHMSAAGAVTGTRWCAFRKFTEVATGMWLPLEYEDGSDKGTSVVEYRYESVNEPIDDAAFVVRFPPGTIVSDERTSTRSAGVLK